MTEFLAADRPATRRWRDVTAEPHQLAHPGAGTLAHIPGRRGLPFVGAMPWILADPLGFSRAMTEAHGRVYRFHAFGRWHVHAAGPDAIEKVLFDPGTGFSAYQGWGQVIEPLFPGALLIRDGPRHRTERRLMGEAFRQAPMSGYQEIFARDIAAAVASWQGRDIDLYAEVRALTFRVSASTFLGVALDDNDADEAMGALSTMMASLLAMVRAPCPSLARTRARFARARLERILSRLIAEKRRAPGRDFLSRMANLTGEDGGLLPVRSICESFAFLLSAAHDTLASALTSLGYYLALHPDWAERLRAELDTVGVAASVEAAHTSLPLMDMVFKETMRINGPAPIIWRRALAPAIVEGRLLPAGTMVGVNLMMAHRLPDIWPQPERFDPLRFTPERELERGRFAFAPFGAGVHKCLGLHFAGAQARIFMAELLRCAALRLPAQPPVRWYHWPNCRPRKPLVLGIAPRRRGR